ncbi:MAG: tagatose 1,6-diphosphate aldolase [Dehalococcoidia bacterium]|nr:tagatose 1,6-diphosphate aldolase [Dehalococcoidia bacterium]
MKTLSIGKYRGMQRISNTSGSLCMCALDHRGSLQKMLEGVLGRAPVYQDMVDFKLDMCRALSSQSSAMLLDPLFGAAQSIASGLLSSHSGLVVSLEETGYEGDAAARISRELANWSAAKVRRMGADGAKLLLYYRPGVDVAAVQLDLVRKLAADCDAQDLVFVVEPVGYAIGDEASTGRYSTVKPDVVIQTAKDISPLGIDVLKAEFPADLKVEKDEGRMLEFCKRLDGNSEVPWIILSAGVDFSSFQREVEIASKAGASGFLAGRALWQEATSMKTREQRVEFFHTTVVERLRVISALADAYGTPWFERVGAPSIVEGWEAGY